MLVVRQQRKPCRRFVGVSAARRGRQTTKHAVQIERVHRQLTSVRPRCTPARVHARSKFKQLVNHQAQLVLDTLCDWCNCWRAGVTRSRGLRSRTYHPSLCMHARSACPPQKCSSSYEIGIRIYDKIRKLELWIRRTSLQAASPSASQCHCAISYHIISYHIRNL